MSTARIVSQPLTLTPLELQLLEQAAQHSTGYPVSITGIHTVSNAVFCQIALESFIRENRRDGNSVKVSAALLERVNDWLKAAR